MSSYLVALVATAAAVLLRWLLDPVLENDLPLVTLYGAVAIAVWFGGYRPALLATALGYLACDYLFLDRRGSFYLHVARNLAGMFAFLFTCSIIIGFGEVMRIAVRRATKQADAMEALNEYAENIVETVREPMLVLDARLAVRTANRSFYRAFRVAREETEGRRVYDLGNGQWDIPALRTLLEEILPQNTSFDEFEVTHEFPSLGRRVMLVNARRMYRAGNHTELILLAIEDITERRKLEDERRELETRFTSLVKNIRDHSIFTLDPQGRITSWNREAENILGYSEAEALGQHFSIIFTPEDLEAGVPAQELTTAMSEGRAEDERWHARKGGERFWALGIVTPTTDARGAHTGYSKILRDMTDRKRAEEALRREHELSEVIIDSSQHIILLLDTEGRIVRFNKYMEELTGYRLAEVHFRDWFDTFLPERERERIRALFERALGGERTRGNVNAIVTKDGREVEIEWYDAPLTSAEGNPIGVLSTGQDITERQRAQEALRDREERMRAILNTAADAIITIDRRGIITAVNLATEQMFGYTQDELVGQNVKILMPPPYRDEHDGYIQHYLETAEARIIGIGREVVGRRKDGSLFPVGLAISEVDHLGLFTGVIRDISERHKLQRDVLGIAEDEQRRIGQDLHDSTQQELAGLGMLAQALFSNLSQESSDRPKASVDIDKCCKVAKRILDGLTRAHQELQGISRGLVPIRLNPAGLMDALRELASRTDELPGVTCAFKCEQPVEVAESFAATHLYRIAQEAVTNALKHARPEHILIALESDNGHPTLQVADDGTGFNSSAKSEGMGLKTMQYRASLIGANLTISPIEAGGTLLTCRVLGGG